MRFPSLKNNAYNREKTETAEEFNFGINDDKGDAAQKGNLLKDCVNMHFYKGRLRTRPGFFANELSVIDPEMLRDYVYFPFTVTDAVCYRNSNPYNLAYSCTGDFDGADMRFYLVDRQGNISPAGGIDFHRVDSSCYYAPVKVFFTVGDPVSGSGVFAFIARASGSDRLNEVLEANADFTAWNSVKSAYYVPTIRINGRGERYDQADTYTDLNFPAPDRPEELNILTGKFRCYYTSDGFSSIFRLPYGNLNPAAAFRCRVYTAPEVYTDWNVPQGETNVTATIGGVSVKLYLNRTLGVIRFYSNSADYSMPHMENCKLNNIEVVAETLDSGSEDEIATCSGSVSLDSRIYLYGSGIRKNCVYCTKQANPLYFPQSTKLFLGDGGTAVTSIKVQNGKLIAFKPGETYRIITSFEEAVKEKEAVLPERTTYIKGDTLGMLSIDTGIGCPYPETIRLCGNRLVWLAGDKNVYALATTTYGNTTNIYRISQPLGERLQNAVKPATKPFAVTHEGQYLLFADENVFVMNYRVRGFGYSKTYYAGDDEIKSPAWYIWKLPRNVYFTGGAVVQGTALAVCKGKDDVFFYLSLTGGDRDISLVSGENGPVAEETPIEAEFATKEFDLGSAGRFKRIDAVFINGKSDLPLTLTAADKEREYSAAIRTGRYDFVKINGGMPAAGGISVKISGTAPFEIKNIGIKYKLLCDRG